MRFPSLFAIALAMAACTTVDEMRSSAPVQSAAFERDYREVADCLIDRLSADYDVAATAQLSERSTKISYILGNADMRVPGWEITVRETVSGQTDAELRSVETIWGTPYAKPDVWDAVMSCAA